MSGVITELVRAKRGCVMVSGVALAVRSFEGSPTMTRERRAAASGKVVQSKEAASFKLAMGPERRSPRRRK